MPFDLKSAKVYSEPQTGFDLNSASPVEDVVEQPSAAPSIAPSAAPAAASQAVPAVDYSREFSSPSTSAPFTTPDEQAASAAAFSPKSPGTPMLPGSVMYGFAPPPATTTKIERMGAPITEETRQQLEAALSTMTPEQRDKAETRTDWVGSSLRAIRRQQRATDRALGRAAPSSAPSVPIVPISTPELGEGRVAAEIDASRGSIINTPERPGYVQQAGQDLARGIEQTKGLAYGLGAIAADSVGANETGDALLNKYMQAEEEGGHPIIGSFRNARNLDDWVRYGIEGVFQNLPNMAPSLVTGGVGAAVARRGVEKGVLSFIEKKVAEGLTADEAKLAAGALINKAVARGAGAGAYLASAGMEIGNIYGDTYKDTGVKAIDISAGMGALAGAFDVIPEMAVFKRVFGTAAADELKRTFLQKAKAVGIESLKQFPIGGITEGIQTLIEKGATRMVDGKPYLTPELRDEVIDSILQGGIAGTVIGGASEAVGQRTRRKADDVRVPPNFPGASGPPPTTPPPGTPPTPPAATPPRAREAAPIPASEVLGTPESGAGAAIPTVATPAPPEPVAPATAQPAQPFDLKSSTPVPPDAPDVAGLTSEVDRVRAAGIELSDWLKQGDVLGRDLHPETVDILTRLDEIGRDPDLSRAFTAAFGAVHAQQEPTAEAVPATAEHDTQPVQAGPEARSSTRSAQAAEGGAGEGQTVGVRDATQGGQQQEGDLLQHPRDVARGEERGREDRQLPSAQHDEGAAGGRGRGLPQGGPVQPVGGSHDVQQTGQRGPVPARSTSQPGGAQNARPASGSATGAAAANDGAQRTDAGIRGEGGVGGGVRVDENGRELHAAEVAGKQVETHTNPSPAQIEAGNYQKGPVWVSGLKLRIENPQGSTRRSKPGAKTKWERTMAHHYGYIVETSQGTPQKGRDKDHVDVLVGDGDKVFVVDQKNPGTGVFDEHKVMLNFGSLEEAKQAYLANYPKGWKGLQSITETTHQALQDWLHNGDTSKRFAPQSISNGLEERFAKLHRALRTVIGEERMKPLYRRLSEQLGAPEGDISAAQLRKAIPIVEQYIREMGEGPKVQKLVEAVNERTFDRNEQLALFNRGMTANRGINVEVAPNPDDKALTARFDALPENGKRTVSREVADEIIPLVLADMKIDGSIEHTIGGFEGKTNPSIIVRFGPGVSFAEMEEAAKALGYVFSQKAVIAYDVNDKVNGTQTGFVRVAAERPLSYEEQHDIFAEVVKHFPDAGGFTGHEGAMVFGNYTRYGDNPLTDEQYHQKLDDALGMVHSDLSFDTERDHWRSEYDQSQSLEGTRYGKGKEGAARDNARPVAARGPWRLDALRAQAAQAVARSLPGIRQNRGASKQERALTAESILDGSETLSIEGKPLVYTVARALEERARKIGLSLTGQDDTTRETIARIIAHETALAISKSPEAIGWYRHRLENAVRLASLLYPEIGAVDDARFAFTLALAITSNGQTIASNVDYAFYVYSRYRNTGKFPTDLEIGPRSEQINGSFAKVNQLIKENDFDGARHFLTTKIPAGALIRMGFGMKELVSEEVYGGSILGPKIGGAFLQNLNGNYEALTIDRWLMRTWGRIIGNLTFHGTERQANAAARLREQMKKKGLKGDLLTVANELYDAADRRGFKNMTVIEKAARRYLSAGVRDAPETGRDRSFMRKTFSRVKDMLSDQHGVTIADIQAVLWYVEKELYKKLGVVDRRAEKTDYQKEVETYLREQGVTDEQIQSALQPVGGRGRDAEAIRSEGPRANRGEQAAEEANAPAAVGPEQRGDGVRSGGTGLRPQAPALAPLPNAPVGENTPVVNVRPVQPDAVRLVGIHYSPNPGIHTLHGSSYGASTSRALGAEWERLQKPGVDRRIKRRVYFYWHDGGRIPSAEPAVSGAHVYRAVLSNILDTRSETAMRLFREAGRDSRGNLNMSEFERLVVDAGYDGYVNTVQKTIVALDANIEVESMGRPWEAKQKAASEVRFKRGVANRIADMDVPGGEPRKFEDEFTRFERAAWVLAQMARDEKFFVFPTSKAKTLQGVAKDFDPAITVEKYPASSKDLVAVYEVAIPPAVSGQSPARFMLRQTKDGAIHANLASMRSGRGQGAKAYQITAEWARNAGLRFEGDPDGLEPIAHARRAEAMISSFLKSGTTAHMEPHEYMIEDGFMDDADAIDPRQALKKWRKMDDLTKLALTVRYAYGKILAAAPADFGDVRYDFENGRFYHLWDTGKALEPAWFDALAKHPQLRPIGGGSRTLRRAAVVNTVLQAHDRESWSRILAGVRSWQDGGNPRSLAGLAYQQAPISGRKAEGFPAGDARRAINKVLSRWRNAPKITLHDNIESAQAALKAAGYDLRNNWIDGQTKGFFLPGDGIHIILPNFTSQRDVLTTLAHEAVAHHGVREILGKDEWGRLLRDVDMLRKAGNRHIARLDESVRSTHGELPVAERMDEIIARAAEEAVDANGNVRPGFGWFKRVLRRVAEWLRSIGIDVPFTHAELQGILSMSARNIEGGPGSAVRMLGSVAQNRSESAPEQAGPKPVFYSALGRAIEKAPLKTAPASQWESWLAANAAKLGVKKDEIEWSGVNEWLDTREGNVSREEVASFLAQNGVQVSEVMLGERGLPEGFSMKSTGDYGDEYTISGPGITAVGNSPMMAAINAQERLVRQGAQWQKNGDNEKAQRFFERAEELTLWIEAYEGKGEATDTKFQSYVLPGGKNYRELLLTLPEPSVEKVGNGYLARDNTGASWGESAKTARDSLRGPEFKSSHFGQPNILAHVRFNERTDGDGKRVLFIEEIQSDWAQKGRSVGFGDTDRTEAGFRRWLVERRGMSDWSADRTVKGEFEVPGASHWQEFKHYNVEKVPPAPFVGKTEAWVALALKRMIRYAVDNGFDRVAWTTGEQQAERYDLSQKVRSIVWSAEENGFRTVKINFVDQGRWVSFDVDRNGIASNAEGEVNILNGNNIESILGKDIAQRITETDHGKLVGADLKLGGEGMRAFYDKIVPQVANDVLKKLGEERAYRFPVKVAGKFEEQPSFDITPTMAEKVSQGLPLFNRGRAGGASPRVGLLDAALRFPGKYVARFITQPVWTRVSGLVDRITPERWKHGLISDYGLPEPYLDAKLDRLARTNQMLRKTHNLINQIQALDRQQARVAYIWMTESPDLDAESQIMATLPAEAREALVEMKRVVTEVGQEAVNLGLLDQEVYDRNKLTYLHRSYQKYMREDYERNDAMKRRAIAILGDQFKGRGMRDDVTKGDLQYESTPFAKGNKYLRLETRDAPPADAPPNARGRLRKVVYWPAANPIPEMYQDMRVDGTWEARWVDGDRVGMWRDFTREEREMMGEIDEVRFAFGHTMMKSVRDVETARFLKWAADNYSVATAAEVEAAGGTVVQGVDRLGTTQAFKTDEWVEVPNITIPGTKVKKYGALAGRYVPAPMFNDLRQVVNIKVEFGDTYQKMLRAWKVAKTGLSPAVHMNNIMSNFVMADWADLRARDIGIAALTVIKAKRGNEDAKRMIERFSDNGGDLGNFAHIELGDNIEKILREELDQELAAASDAAAGPLGLVRMAQVLDLAFHGRVREAMTQASMTKAWRATVWPLDRMKEIYGQEDTVFRLAKFMKEVNEGATDTQAGKAARDAFLNYEINAPWVNAMRRTALPFIAFSYRAIPLLARTVRDKPWKFAKYFSVFGALNALTYAMLGLGGDDEDKERRLLPDELQGRIFGIFPRLIRMPWDDSSGSPVFLDARRWVPVGDVFETQPNAALPLPAWLSVGGPLAMAVEMLANKSTFTGKPIVNESDTKVEKAAKILDYQFKFWSPNLPLPNPVGLAGEALVPGIPVGWLQTYSASNIRSAFKGKTDDFGRERTPGYEFLNSIGIKLRPYPPDQMLLNERRKTDSAIREIDQKIGGIRRQYQRGGLSDEEFNKEIAYQSEKKAERIEEFKKKAGLQ